MSRTSTANGDNGSSWIARKIRLALYARDTYTCLFCRCVCHTDVSDDRCMMATLDHLDGNHKNNKRRNLATVCYRCNSRKKDTDADVFLGKILREDGPYPPIW